MCVCVLYAPINISPPPGRDEVGQGGDLTILKIKCPTPGGWFHRQILDHWGFNLYSTLHFCAQSQMPNPSGLFLRSNAVKSPISSPPLLVQGVVDLILIGALLHPYPLHYHGAHYTLPPESKVLALPQSWQQTTCKEIVHTTFLDGLHLEF